MCAIWQVGIPIIECNCQEKPDKDWNNEGKPNIRVCRPPAWFSLLSCWYRLYPREVDEPPNEYFWISVALKVFADFSCTLERSMILLLCTLVDIGFLKVFRFYSREVDEPPKVFFDIGWLISICWYRLYMYPREVDDPPKKYHLWNESFAQIIR